MEFRRSDDRQVVVHSRIQSISHNISGKKCFFKRTIFTKLHYIHIVTSWELLISPKQALKWCQFFRSCREQAIIVSDLLILHRVLTVGYLTVIIAAFNLYILFSPLRLRVTDATEANSFFKMSSYADTNKGITYEKIEGKLLGVHHVVWNGNHAYKLKRFIWTSSTPFIKPCSLCWVYYALICTFHVYVA